MNHPLLPDGHSLLISEGTTCLIALSLEQISEQLFEEQMALAALAAD
jgi:hypothetical protein